MLHPRLEAANDVDDVEELNGVLVQQQALVRNSGILPLLDRGSRLEADNLSKNVLRSVRYGVYTIASQSINTIHPMI